MEKTKGSVLAAAGRKEESGVRAQGGLGSGRGRQSEHPQGARPCAKNQGGKGQPEVPRIVTV